MGFFFSDELQEGRLTALEAIRMSRGLHTITSGEATANKSTVVTGLGPLTGAVIQVRAADGHVVTSDAVVTINDGAAGTLSVGDGSTFNTTAGYIVTWIAW